jgi:hypothetical protein
METALGIFIGISLSAAAGFRVFVPLLVMSITANTGNLTLSEGFEWIGSTPALLAFSAATIVEVLAYYIPFVDNLLDTIATPAAVVAGVVLTASTVTGVSPFLAWSLAIIAGGGVAATVQTASGALRLTTTAATGGAGNFAVSTGELAGASILSILGVLVPVAGVLIVGLALLFVVILYKKKHAALQR